MFLSGLIAVLLLGAQEPGNSAEPRHWTNGQLAWARMPMPSQPSGESGVMQAEATCTVAEGGRVRECRINRIAPENTRFGRAVLSSLRRARLTEGRAAPGDTMTFVIWACSETSEPCRKIPWPDE